MTTRFLDIDEIYPTNYVAGLMGLPKTGKTLWAFQQGFPLIKEKDGKILYLNTEESSRFFLDTWEEVFQKKYDVKPKIDFRYLPTAEDLLGFCGIHGNVVIQNAKAEKKATKKEKAKEEGKEEDVEEDEESALSPQKKEKGIVMQWQNKSIDLEGSDLMKALTEGDVTYVVVDSITAAFNSLIAGGQQNYPLRAVTEKMFFTTFQRIVDRSKQQVHIMTTHHVSYNPTSIQVNQFHMIEEMLKEEGGKPVGHGVKVMFAMEKRTRPHGGRLLHVVRYPNLPEFSKSYRLLIDNNGFRRATEEEFVDVNAQQKAEKVIL
jgi:KaiC/GvpD/RAD55 family RecA-like ATPase